MYVKNFMNKLEKAKGDSTLKGLAKVCGVSGKKLMNIIDVGIFIDDENETQDPVLVYGEGDGLSFDELTNMLDGWGDNDNLFVSSKVEIDDPRDFYEIDRIDEDDEHDYFIVVVK